ncbi:MAG: hypothetical protein KKB04_04910 [Candidatus Thermoplasmatota archaeon]|nr:hypothetical protein [Candidatus Thermoplasmatota archaeon]
MDLLSIGLGVLIGIVVTAFMVEIGMRKILPWGVTSRLTSSWNLNEIKDNKTLLIMAEKIENVEIPKNSRVIVKQREGTALLKGAEVVVNQDVHSNFAVGSDRALIFTSSIHPNAFTVWTTNEKMIRRLTSEFNRLWMEGK